MNAKQILQRTVNKAIANGSPVVREIPVADQALLDAGFCKQNCRSTSEAARAMLAALQMSADELKHQANTAETEYAASQIDAVIASVDSAIAQARAAGITPA